MRAATAPGSYAVARFGLDFEEEDIAKDKESKCRWSALSGAIDVTKYEPTGKPNGAIVVEATVTATMEAIGDVTSDLSPCFGRSKTAGLTGTVKCEDYRH